MLKSQIKKTIEQIKALKTTEKYLQKVTDFDTSRDAIEQQAQNKKSIMDSMLFLNE